jgi:hypothetical protein
MTDTTDIVERLRADDLLSCDHSGAYLHDVCCIVEEGADTITRLRSQLKEMAEALGELTDACFREFCSDATEGEFRNADDEAVAHPSSHITFGAIRRARSALSRYRGEA